jgi:hypothetical protein
MPVVSRMKRRDEMARRKSKKDDVKEAKAAIRQEIPPEKYFVLRSGVTIKDIAELALALDSIADSDFSFHVNDSKNDFANWIGDVFGNKELADSIRPVKDKKESQILLLKHLFLDKGMDNRNTFSKEVRMDG